MTTVDGKLSFLLCNQSSRASLRKLPFLPYQPRAHARRALLPCCEFSYPVMSVIDLDSALNYIEGLRSARVALKPKPRWQGEHWCRPSLWHFSYSVYTFVTKRLGVAGKRRGRLNAAKPPVPALPSAR